MDKEVCVFEVDSLTYTGICTGCVINPKLIIFHREERRQ